MRDMTPTLLPNYAEAECHQLCHELHQANVTCHAGLALVIFRTRL